jgi:predicted lipoprotein with Yx(FWY)xxD motif
MTLYLYTKDTPNTSTCYDQCATNWPPLLTTADPIAGEGVDAALLGTTTRTDGSIQVTYNGWPLYYYAKDAAPGDATGQDVGSVWYVVSAAGEQIMNP